MSQRELSAWIERLAKSAIRPVPAPSTGVDASFRGPDDIDEEAPLLPLESGNRLSVRPHYYLNGLQGATGSIMVRQPLIKRLHQAAAMIPVGFELTVLDGWRSEELQREVYKRISQSAQAAGDGKDAAVFAFDLDRRGVTLPYPSDDAPHRTGGAVDVALFGPDGKAWPMGTEFDEISDRSAMRALEESEVAERAAVIGRRVLYFAMVAAGFVNYPEEWWHFDYGNAFWRFFGALPEGRIFRTINSPGDDQPLTVMVPDVP